MIALPRGSKLEKWLTEKKPSLWSQFIETKPEILELKV